MMLHLSDDLGLFQSKIPSGEAEEVSFSEQGAARQPLLLDSHRWQGIFQNDYTDFAIGMTAAVAMQSEKKTCTMSSWKKCPTWFIYAWQNGALISFRSIKNEGKFDTCLQKGQECNWLKNVKKKNHSLF